MAVSSSATLLNTPRRMRSAVMRPKKRSTWLSHDADVGVKWHVETWMPLKPSLHFGVLVCGIVVGDQVQVQPLWGVAVDGA